jgi:hypothetical protein
MPIGKCRSDGAREVDEQRLVRLVERVAHDRDRDVDRLVIPAEPQHATLAEEVGRARGRSLRRRVAHRALAALSWVAVKLMVSVPALPSVTVTSLMEMVGNGAASDAAGAETTPETVRTSRASSGRKRAAVRGREGFMLVAFSISTWWATVHAAWAAHRGDHTR